MTLKLVKNKNQLKIKFQQQSNKTDPKPRCKKTRAQQPSSAPPSQSASSSSTSPISTTVPEPAVNNATTTSPTSQGQPVCDKPLANLQTLPDFSSFETAFDSNEAAAGKVPIPRLNRATPAASPRRQRKYKPIQPKPCDNAAYKIADNGSQRKKRKSSPDGELERAFTRERLESVGSVDKDAMDEYLGTNNSQEHEEELVKYFQVVVLLLYYLRKC